MKKTTTWAIALLAVGTVFTSCTKDEKDEITPDATSDRMVFVGYAGNFGQANAGLTTKNLTTGEIVTDAYTDVNAEQLGGTLQSVTGIGDNIYLCASVASEGIDAKVVVVNNSTLEKVGEIPCVNPQYISAIGNSQAIVTNYTYGGTDLTIDLVDLTNNTILNSIAIPEAVRQIVSVNDKSYFVNTAKAYLYVIDHATFTISDSIEVGMPASGVIVDENNKLWVGIGQAWGSTDKGKLIKVNPSNNTVELSLEANEKIGSLAYSSTEDAVIYEDGGAIYEMSISATTLPAQALTSLTTTTFYGLGVDGETGDIYVSDALDYASPSAITQYSKTGELQSTFNTGGANAASFWFK